MTVTGIIMECNPFHGGHAYLLERARSETGADHIVVVMSGDYVQRGEPAVFDKYVRAEQILRAGADLVLELPLYAACGSAEYFARGGILLLEKLGVVTDLCFGSESGDLERLRLGAEILDMAEGKGVPDSSGKRKGAPDRLQAQAGAPDHSAEIKGTGPQASLAEHEGGTLYQRLLQKGLRSGQSFPAARAFAVQSLPASPEGFVLPSSPNDLLGMEYLRALSAAGSAIRPHAVPRIEAPSATSLRKELFESRKKALFESQRKERFESPDRSLLESLRKELFESPKESLFEYQRKEFFEKTASEIPFGSRAFPLFADDFSDQLLYALRMQEDHLEEFWDVTPAIADRIRNLLPQYRDYSQFRDLLKTRNLTSTRISRCLLHILLQIRTERAQESCLPDAPVYARPLALRRSCGALLSSIRRNAKVPFLSKLSAAKDLLPADSVKILQEEIRAEELYAMTRERALLLHGTDSAGALRAAQRRLVVLP